jgi:hypothetical protein
MKMILICATPRSGSTTLQRIVNTIKDANITGEKHGAIDSLLECYLKIKLTNGLTLRSNNGSFLTAEEHENKKIKPSWYNCYNFHKVRKNIKNTIVSILTKNNSERVLGYKEVRWFGKLYLIDEFIELFPNSKIICNISDDLDRQSISSFWKENKDSKQHLNLYNKQIIEYSERCNNAYLNYMKNLFDIKEVRKLFDFIEEKLDEEQYEFIIKNNHKDYDYEKGMVP